MYLFKKNKISLGPEFSQFKFLFYEEEKTDNKKINVIKSAFCTITWIYGEPNFSRVWYMKLKREMFKWTFEEERWEIGECKCGFDDVMKLGGKLQGEIKEVIGLDLMEFNSWLMFN